ncbi:hypothetical protein R3P38DRAFT_3453804 [Favolaschia claudopus]|uniref:Uncharacterized protein n=1 Tax=Favolaschia claudopus TaxID=2862362 RepID=A0AAW0CQW5_9AGAR
MDPLSSYGADAFVSDNDLTVKSILGADAFVSDNDLPVKSILGEVAFVFDGAMDPLSRCVGFRRRSHLNIYLPSSSIQMRSSLPTIPFNNLSRASALHLSSRDAAHLSSHDDAPYLVPPYSTIYRDTLVIDGAYPISPINNLFSTFCSADVLVNSCGEHLPTISILYSLSFQSRNIHAGPDTLVLDRTHPDITLMFCIMQRLNFPSLYPHARYNPRSYRNSSLHLTFSSFTFVFTQDICIHSIYIIITIHIPSHSPLTIVSWARWGLTMLSSSSSAHTTYFLDTGGL